MCVQTRFFYIYLLFIYFFLLHNIVLFEIKYKIYNVSFFFTCFMYIFIYVYIFKHIQKVFSPIDKVNCEHIYQLV